MKRQLLRNALAFLLCSGLPLPLARAQQAPSDADAARGLVREGDALLAQGDAEHALEHYSTAYRLVHVPTLGLEVARVLALRGRLLQAKTTLDEIARMQPIAGEPATFARARASAGELSASLMERIPSVLIEVSPEGLQPTLEIDAVVVPKDRTRSPLRLDPGAHRLQVRAPGYTSIDQQLPLREGEHRQLAVALVREIAAPTSVAAAALPSAVAAPANVPAPGSAEPAAFPSSALLDATPRVDVTALATTTSAAGAPALTNPAADTAPTPSPSALTQPFSSRSSPASAARPGAAQARTHTLVGLVVAGVGALAGTSSGLLALSTKPNCPSNVCNERDVSKVDRSRTYGNVANVSFAVGGAGLLYGLGWWVFGAAAVEPDAASDVALAILPDCAGAVLQLAAGF